MASCGSLEPTNIDSQDPWKPIKSIRDVSQSQSPSFKKIFSELHHLKPNNPHLFQDPSSPPSNLVILGDESGSLESDHNCPDKDKNQYKLGAESFDDADNLLKNEVFTTASKLQNTKSFAGNGSPNETQWGELRRSRTCMANFPPPISCIARCGKPFVRFRSYRENGRFILKEIRVPELLQARRENGRLRMNLIHSDDDEDEEDV